MHGETKKHSPLRLNLNCFNLPPARQTFLWILSFGLKLRNSLLFAPRERMDRSKIHVQFPWAACVQKNIHAEATVDETKTWEHLSFRCPDGS